jgi:hypothetical protein
VEASSIDTHYDPGVWKEDIGRLEGFDVFIPVKSLGLLHKVFRTLYGLL